MPAVFESRRTSLSQSTNSNTILVKSSTGEKADGTEEEMEIYAVALQSGACNLSDDLLKRDDSGARSMSAFCCSFPKSSKDRESWFEKSRPGKLHYGGRVGF